MEVTRKLDDETYNRLFVTSDTHFNHNKEFVYAARGYENPQVMTEDMIETINSVVGPEGILLHLGDFCLNTTTEQYHDILRKLKIKELWMLWGNHNNPIQKNWGGTREQICAFNQGLFIKYLGHYFTFRRGKRAFVCFHFPMTSFDGMSHGSMHLCGHSHGDLAISRPENKTHKILDCGWDVHKKPLTMKEIELIMDTKNINTTHHD
jgi:calcineurin-like phosphoesterase family protein